MNVNEKLSLLVEKGLFRSLYPLPACGGKISWQGKQLLNFSSNDYLNLATDERLKKASMDATKEWGCGSTASQLMSGYLTIHKQLEKKLADMIDSETALVFGSGFLANVGVITALTEPGDLIFFDRLCHASLLDGIRLSKAKWYRFRHNNLDHLEDLLKKYKNSEGQKFIVVDSIFSMDGDIAPVKDIHFLTQLYNAFLIVDEAHAIGIMGNKGGGVCQRAKIKPDLITGTMSKALGNYGGFTTCSKNIRDLIINRARSFIFSTSIPPSCLAGSMKAIDIIQDEHNLGIQLLEKARYFCRILKENGFNVPDSQSQIIPVIIGDNQKALNLADALLADGIYVKAIRPPTVPKGSARIRLSVTLAHNEDDLYYTTEKMVGAAKQLNII